MTTLHHIGELLQSGVRPTEEETEHLRSLGGFVAEMFGRYLTGNREGLTSGPDSWSKRLSGRLSAANGARWEQGLGLGEMFLASDLTSFWQVAKNGFSEGYGNLEADRGFVDLYEEDVAPQAAVQSETSPRRRRPSLFGAKGTQSPARTSRAATPNTAKPSAAMRAARWADGGTAEMAVVKALASGGLFVGDQVTQLIAETGEVFSRGASKPAAIGGAARTPSTSTYVSGSALGPAAVSLDGLRIDGRTPALASALARAEAVFGRGDSMLKPAVAAARMDKLSSIVPFSMAGVDRGYGLGERPVYGFYDAAETTFVSLPNDTTPAVEAEAAVGTTPVRGGRAPARRGGALAPSSRSLRQPAAAAQAQGRRAEGQRSQGPRSATTPNLSLDSLVRPAVTSAGVAPIRPLTNAAMSAPDVSLAHRVVFTPGGAAVPQVQRGGAFAPRSSVTLLSSITGAPVAVPNQQMAMSKGFDAALVSGVAAHSQDQAAGVGGQSRPVGGQVFQGAALPGQATSAASLTGLRSAQFARLAARTMAQQSGGPAESRIEGRSQTGSFGMDAPVWRLAADGGPDLPIGAGFTGPEVFAAMMGAQGGRELRQTGVGFRPTVASERAPVGGAASEGSAQVANRTTRLADGVAPSRLADMVDGLVWVSLPTDSQPVAGDQDSLSGMGLTAIPTGRRSAMVPARVALSTIAARSNEAGRAQAFQRGLGSVEFGNELEAMASGASAQAGGFGRMVPQLRAGLPGVEPAAGGVGPARASGQVGATMISPAERANFVQQLATLAQRSAVSTGVTALSSGLVPQAAGTQFGTSEAAQGGATGLGRFFSTMVRPQAGVGPAQALASGALGSVAAQQDMGAALGPGSQADGRPTSGLLAGAERGLAAISAEAGQGQAFHGAFAEALQALSGSYRGAVAWTPGVISERLARAVEGAIGSGYGRLDSERVMLAATSAETAAPVAGAEAEGQTGMGRSVGRRLAGRIGRPALGGAPATSPAAVQATASAARQALMRPVSTAREARAVAATFSTRGVMGGLGSMSVNSIHATGSDEPMLGRIVAARTEAGGQLAGAASRWESSPELMARIASLESGARRELGQTLRMAGWNESELQMLRLDTGEARAAAQADASPELARAHGPMARLNAARMNRSLARVVAGAESLGGPVESKASGSKATSVAARLAPSPMPMLEGRVGQDYFGSLTSNGGPAVGYASLRDELGALVQVAEAAASRASDPVAAEASSGLLARARSVLGRATGADRAAASKLLARIEAVASRAAESGRFEQAGQLGSLAQSMGGARAFEGRASTPVSGVAQGFDDQLARIEGAADVSSMGLGRVGAAGRAMDFDQVEMSVLALEREVTPNLEARLAQALALSTAGPAGVRRIMGGASRAEPRGLGEKQDVRKPGVARGEQPITVESLRAGAERGPVGSQARGTSTERRQLAALIEELGANLPVSLNKVIAPEAMLQGLRSPELSAVIQTMRSRGHQLGAEMTRVLTTLADSGIDLSAARSSLAGVAKEIGLTDIERFAAVPVAEGTSPIRGYESVSTASELADASPEQAFLQLVNESVVGGASAGSRSLAQVAAMVRRGGLSRTQRAGLLSSLLRGSERSERTSLLEEAGGSEFAFAWLSRVDGTRTGLDIGLGDTREEFGRAFGGRRDSAVSMDSPIAGASLVSPVSERGAGGESSGRSMRGNAGGRGPSMSDKSGLRSVAAAVTHTTTGAARPQHGASQAVRRTDWSFVDTGSRASTTHADLGRLASAIVSSSGASQRAPMPLVAPAVKAVAQTALRDSKTSSAPSQPAQGSGGASADAGKRGPVDAKMSEKAIEMLAVEMANRVARLMGLMKERIGVWS